VDGGEGMSKPIEFSISRKWPWQGLSVQLTAGKTTIDLGSLDSIDALRLIEELKRAAALANQLALDFSDTKAGSK